MANTVTIDNYDIKKHQRYASDQEALKGLEIKFEESGQIPQHLELAGGSILIKSKWEALFETDLHRHPFALFVTPPQFAKMRKRFFSYSISSQFNWDEANEDEQQQEQKGKGQFEEYKNKILSKKSKLMPIALFEKDRSALLNLLDSVQSINSYLREIYARKLQYQKG